MEQGTGNREQGTERTESRNSALLHGAKKKQKKSNISFFTAIVVFRHLTRFASQFADRFASRES